MVFRGHVIGQPVRRRAVLVRIGEDPDMVEPDGADEFLELVKVSIRLPGEAGDEGRAQGDPRQTAADPVEQPAR